jgi:hypothetical protein
MMDLVSQALESNPSIFVKTFGWKYGTSDIDPNATKSAAAPTESVAATGARWQSGLIDGEVRPFRGDYRAAIDAINQFADTIRKQEPVKEVKVVKLPLNIDQTLTLAGNTTENREQVGKAEFKLIVIFKP